ncbi:hypothetical protein [Legionella spiritensis]|uniref:Uncharacterized protein n=1 Tax=Legionella spiritensis TaxID=452 RepID=A0A0W0Z030_LEGSP|nr:hypothetical protein [Legionella spiritensis]KTD62118.1 hypothetical protein Lspi_1968 [Legionella spiritensis]SNV34137.1 Uncharacterised protein [Legionella spiritensis]
MTYEEMKRILLYCQILGFEGLNNGHHAIIPELRINLPERHTFLGVNSNPAIFVTEVTYKKLKKFHEDWIPNITIAIDHTYLLEPKKNNIDIIGVLVHEAGHAFNVYAKIPNTEANAYIFEIEALFKLYKMGILSRQFGIDAKDMITYFQSRMSQYKIVDNNLYLKFLIDDITDIFRLEKKSHDLTKTDRIKSFVNAQIKIGFFNQGQTIKVNFEEENPLKRLFIRVA